MQIKTRWQAPATIFLIPGTRFLKITIYSAFAHPVFTRRRQLVLLALVLLVLVLLVLMLLALALAALVLLALVLLVLALLALVLLVLVQLPAVMLLRALQHPAQPPKYKIGEYKTGE